MKRLYLAAAVMLALTAPAAYAADAVRADVVRADGFVRLNLVWPDTDAEAPIAVAPTIDNQVLVLRFSRAVDLDLAPILDGMAAEAALARLDPDGRTLRLALKYPARAHVSRSYNVIAIDLLPPEASDPPDVVSPRAAAELEVARRAAEAPPVVIPPPPPLPVEVRRASSPAFDRIVFEWPEHVDYTLGERGGVWVLGFSRDGVPDLAPLRADPPQRLSSIAAHRADGRLEVRLTPAPGAAPRAFRERNSIILDLADGEADSALVAQLQALADAQDEAAAAAQARLDNAEDVTAAPAATTPEAAAPETPPAARPDPVPESGVVAVRAAGLGDGLTLDFAWAAAVKTAVFRRAGAIWIVFDAEAILDTAEIGRSQTHVRDVQALAGPGFSALRILAPDTTQVAVTDAAENGARWRFTLADRTDTPPAPLRIERRTDGAPGGYLFANLGGAGAPIAVTDAAVGDTLLVIPAPAPARGVIGRRDYQGFSILPSAHGLAVQSLSRALTVRASADGVLLTPPAALGGRAAPDQLAAAVSPARIAFVSDESAAAHAAARAQAEARVTTDNLAAGQMEMARFLLSRELAPEALGALRLALEADAQLASDPGFRAVRGVANALAGRIAAAETDLSAAALDDDPTAMLWRAFVRAQAGDWTQARHAFAAGEAAIPAFAPDWRARFREAFARTALALNDLTAAKAQLDAAGVETMAPATRLRLDLAGARWREAMGEAQQALDEYDRLARSGDEEIAVHAILAGARLRHELGQSDATALIETLEGLRWRWRGDALELDTIRRLGALYAAEGRTREGLETMKAAVARFPDAPASRGILSDMMTIFADLFLNGGADRLDPVEALALYHQFQELTPVGADGDRMVRRMAERLVAYDLLPQAAELLQHQVDHRLHEPRARAEVAANLALIYMMDRQPEAALRALRNTRVTRLPADLAAERRIIEARALAELGTHDAALDLMAGDASLEAARLRADIAWKERDWPLAGQLLEDMLRARGDAPGPLTAEDSAAVLRAAVAWSLARDGAALARLRERYGAPMQGGANATAFDAVTQELEISGLRLAEIAERAADTAALAAFLQRRRDRLTAPAVTASAGPIPATPAPSAAEPTPEANNAPAAATAG